MYFIVCFMRKKSFKYFDKSRQTRNAARNLEKRNRSKNVKNKQYNDFTILHSVKNIKEYYSIGYFYFFIANK